MQPKISPDQKLIFFLMTPLYQLSKMLVRTNLSIEGVPHSQAFTESFFHYKLIQPLEFTLVSKPCHPEKEKPFLGSVMDLQLMELLQVYDGELRSYADVLIQP